MPCPECTHLDYDPAGQPRCRRYPPVIVTNTGLMPDRAEYPMLPDLKGCGEHAPKPADVVDDPRSHR